MARVSIKDQKLRQLVEKLLVERPECRDNDPLLLVRVWREEFIARYGEERYFNDSFREALPLIVKGILSNAESVRRTRQKIQEKQPLLRGTTYRKRQRHQSAIKKEIRAFN